MFHGNSWLLILKPSLRDNRERKQQWLSQLEEKCVLEKKRLFSFYLFFLQVLKSKAQIYRFSVVSKEIELPVSVFQKAAHKLKYKNVRFWLD